MLREVQYIPGRTSSWDLTIWFYSGLLICALITGGNFIGSNYHSQFWILTSLVLCHNVTELIFQYRINPRQFFLQPVVLGSVVLFLLQLGGITNFLMINSDHQFALLYNSNIKREPYWLVLGMSVVLAASVAYWFGFKLSLGKKLFLLYYKGYK